jgi:hypothetical protein
MEVTDHVIYPTYAVYVFARSLLERKGIWLIFQTLPWDNVLFEYKCGNAIELGDVGESSWKSSLFFVRILPHGM